MLNLYRTAKMLKVFFDIKKLEKQDKLTNKILIIIFMDRYLQLKHRIEGLITKIYKYIYLKPKIQMLKKERFLSMPKPLLVPILIPKPVLQKSMLQRSLLLPAPRIE